MSGSGDSKGDLVPEAASPTVDDISARREVVYQLADEGLAVNAISQSLGVPLGDVELLMSLRSETT